MKKRVALPGHGKRGSLRTLVAFQLDEKAFFIYGFGLTGLVTSLGGLFAIDIAPKRAAGAAMGFIGVFSYLAAALQDQISGHLIEGGMTVVDGVRHYDFSAVIWFWIGASVVSLILASSLWRVRLRD